MKLSLAKSLTVLLTLLALTFSSIGVIPAHAEGIFYVTPDGTGDCSSWGTACGLQTALSIAIAGSEIWVAAGTYKPTAGSDRTAHFQLKDRALYGGFEGVEKDRTERNLVKYVTILSGDLNGNDNSNVDVTEPTRADNVYHVITAGSGAILDGFTIMAGNANGASPHNNGGGMFNDSSSPTLTNVTFINNSASYGGGMYNYSSSPTLTNVTFSSNSAYWNGGGMLNSTGSNPTLMNVTFSGNTAHNHGGGMRNDNSNPTLTNVTFSGNNANYGGGMYNADFSSPMLTNVTFGSNTANNGGGMYNDPISNPIIRNTIFWGNISPNGAQIYNDEADGKTLGVVSDSIVQDGCPAGSTCPNIITADPMLGSLGVYGGFTQAIPLLAGSSAIDTGTNTGCPLTDQRGVTRPHPLGSQCDIGAYEYNSYTGIYYVKPLASGTRNCQSWVNACTLQTALSTVISGDEIWATAGTHKSTTDPASRAATFHLKDGVALYGGFTGTEANRSQRNPTLNITLLSGDIDTNDSQTPIITDLATVTGNTTNSYHVVTGATGATLDGFTITAGYANGGSAADYGGGMYNPSGSSPTLTNVTFSGNLANWGGGMYNNSSSPTLTNVTFSDNSAPSSGGGMYNENSSSPTLTNVTFSGNSANYGGGMINGNSNPTLTNVTFSGNSANSNGGGMYNNSSSPTLTNVTFSGNSANYGGGMFNNSNDTPQIRNAVFWGNTAVNNGAQFYNSGSTPSLSDSVIQAGCPAGTTCTNIITTDPKIGTLGNYGGFTQTIPLLTGSSAINAGASCSAAPVNGRDQRGYLRDASCDIGAYEYGAYYMYKLFLPLILR